ncbi:hypothetical protein [Streptosporangium sp. NPDC049078]|uniref:hypothetical protein n=1 Tax=Streptosporangium sp. NPDC049078 TaxID=3155767 RepID=UPI00342A425F
MIIKAIPTRYAGCWFRSRLEARHAVLFDNLGIRWQYEPEGYLIGPDHDRRPYLPDFYLEDLDVWVEVKGDRAATDLRLLAYAASATYGLPKAVGAWRLLLLGNLPRVDRGWEVWHHAIVSHPNKYGWEGAKPGMLTQHPVWFNGDIIEAGYQGVKTRPGTSEISGWVAPGLIVGTEDDDFASMNDHPDFWRFDAHVRREHSLWPAEWAAYAKARSARFEHGEKP